MLVPGGHLSVSGMSVTAGRYPTDREKRLHQESKAKRLAESAPDRGSTDLFRKREETDEGGSAASYYRNGLLGKFRT